MDCLPPRLCPKYNQDHTAVSQSRPQDGRRPKSWRSSLPLALPSKMCVEKASVWFRKVLSMPCQQILSIQQVSNSRARRCSLAFGWATIPRRPLAFPQPSVHGLSCPASLHCSKTAWTIAFSSPFRKPSDHFRPHAWHASRSPSHPRHLSLVVSCLSHLQ